MLGHSGVISAQKQWNKRWIWCDISIDFSCFFYLRARLAPFQGVHLPCCVVLMSIFYLTWDWKIAPDESPTFWRLLKLSCRWERCCLVVPNLSPSSVTYYTKPFRTMYGFSTRVKPGGVLSFPWHVIPFAQNGQSYLSCLCEHGTVPIGTPEHHDHFIFSSFSLHFSSFVLVKRATKTAPSVETIKVPGPKQVPRLEIRYIFQ